VEKAAEEAKKKEAEMTNAIKVAHAKDQAADEASSKVVEAKQHTIKAEEQLHKEEDQLHDLVNGSAAETKSLAVGQSSLWFSTVACGFGVVLLMQ